MLGVSKYRKEASRPDSRSTRHLVLRSTGFPARAAGQTGRWDGSTWRSASLGAGARRQRARAPTKRGPVVLGASFFASWLTIELVWHHLVIGAALTVGCIVAGGALDTAPGVVGLGADGGRPRCCSCGSALVTRRTVVLVGGALADLEPGPDAPRFPRSHVVLPVPDGPPQGRPRRAEHHRSPASAARPLRLDVTIPSRPGARRWRAAAGAPADPRRRLGHRRQARAGHPAAHPHGRPGLGRVQRQLPAEPRGHVPRPPRSTSSAALAWIREHADEYGIDPDFICVTGGSAGGHLTALMALTAERPHATSPGSRTPTPRVAAAVPFYGIYDFTPDGAFGARPEDVLDRFLEPYGDEGLRGRGAREVRARPRRSHHVHADAPPFFVDPRRQGHPRPGGGRPRRSSTGCRDVSRRRWPTPRCRAPSTPSRCSRRVRTARVIEGVERFLTTIWERRHASARPAVEAELAEALTD